MRAWLLALVLLVTGCERQASPPASSLKTPPPPVPNATRKFEGTKLTYYGERQGFGMQFEHQLLRQFYKDTGIEVRYVPRPLSVTEGYATYQRVFQAHSPDYDAMMIDVSWPGAMADHLLELKLPVEGMLPQLVENSIVDGRLIAIPGYLGAGLLYYRTDLLKKHGYGGPPKTWEELEQMAERIQAGEQATNRRFVGFVFQGYTYEGLTCLAMEWQKSHGGGVFIEEDGSVNVANPGAAQAFSRAAGWIGRIAPKGVPAYQEEDVRNVFEGGNAAFMRHWPYCYASGNSPESPIRGKFDVCPLPGEVCTLGGWEYAVSKYSLHPEAAIELVRYETCPEVQRWRALEGAYLPTITGLYLEPEMIEKMPFCKIMPRVLAGALVRPSRQARTRYNEASSIYFQGVAEIFQGGDAGLVLQAVDHDLKELLAP